MEIELKACEEHNQEEFLTEIETQKYKRLLPQINKLLNNMFKLSGNIPQIGFTLSLHKKDVDDFELYEIEEITVGQFNDRIIYTFGLGSKYFTNREEFESYK